MKNNLKTNLDQLWSGQITHFQHDFLNHCLLLIVQIVSESDVRLYRVAIKEISTVIFDEPNLEVTQDYIWDYMEMSGIEYSPNCEFRYYPGYKYSPDYDYKRAEKEREEKKVGAFNLLMEINETAVYIRAKRLKINDKEYELL